VSQPASRNPAVSPSSGADTLGYVRVSTLSQVGDDKTSLADQTRAITELAGRLKRALSPTHIFEDPGASGQTAEGRPGFMALVRYCEQNPRSRTRVGHVLVMNDSRWGRFDDPEEATYWRVHLSKQGWHVRFAEGDDTDDPIARGVMRSIGSGVSSQYRENIKRNAKRGARGTAAQGYWQTEAPLGYRRVAHGPSGTRVLEIGQRKADDEKVRLGPAPEQEQQLIHWMFERYATGTVSLGSLVRELATRWPERRWSRPTVRAILTNPVYAGDVFWGRRPHDKAERRERWRRPREDWVEAPNAHPALVSRELFTAVEERLKQNKRQTRATAGGYPLSGMIRCAQCNEPYRGGGGPKGPPGDPDRYRFYVDRGGAEGRCTGFLGTLQRRLVEPQVLVAIGTVVAQPSVQHAIDRAFDEALARVDDSQAQRLARLERERTRMEKQRERLIEAIAAGVLTDAEARAKLAACRVELDAVTGEIEQLRFAERRTDGLDAERRRLLAVATEFPGLVKRLQGAELRELIRPWLEDAVVDKVARTLTLKIRRVPASSFLLLNTRPGRG
jgi:DNA invertase Pin-like site-specific DNA recombinase